ncbi:MAG: hypothetical protein AB8H79_26420 [Myxococcota bacterium]
MIGFFLIGLAAIAGLLALVAAIAAIAGVRVPPSVFALGLATPLAIGTVYGRAGSSRVVESALEGGPVGWVARSAESMATIWTPLLWASASVAIAAVLIVLCAAVAGIARGPRRWGLAGFGLGWTALAVVALAWVQLTTEGFDPVSSGVQVAATVVLGVLGSVSLLAGGKKSGPEAAGLGSLVAGLGMASAAVWVVVSEDLNTASALALAPVDTSLSMWAMGTANAMSEQLSGLILATCGVGLGALGASAARKGRGAALMSLSIALGLPALVLTSTLWPAFRAGVLEVGALPMASPSSDVVLPEGTGDYAVVPGIPALELTPSGWYWLEGGARKEISVSRVAPARDIRAHVDAAWPSPAPTPILFIDARLRAEDARAAIDGVIRGPHPVRVGVREQGSDSEHLYWDVRYPDDASSPVLTIDPSVGIMVGCVEGRCSVADVMGFLKDNPSLSLRAPGGLHIHPDTPWGLVTATAAALHELGAFEVPIVFQTRLSVEVAPPE